MVAIGVLVEPPPPSDHSEPTPLLDRITAVIALSPLGVHPIPPSLQHDEPPLGSVVLHGSPTLRSSLLVNTGTDLPPSDRLQQPPPPPMLLGIDPHAHELDVKAPVPHETGPLQRDVSVSGE